MGTGTKAEIVSLPPVDLVMAGAETGKSKAGNFVVLVSQVPEQCRGVVKYLHFFLLIGQGKLSLLCQLMERCTFLDS